MSRSTNRPEDASPGARPPYAAPKIEWEEVLEEAGVYAACAKTEFDPVTPACLSAPMDASGS
jgi:hypothetical protein